jgi:hypothetical protein
VLVSTVFDAPHGWLDVAIASAIGGLEPEVCPKFSTRHNFLISSMAARVV